MVFCSKKGSPHKQDGPWSWLICFISTLINTIQFGLLLSFGVLLPVLSDHFKRSKGTTAWIGSLALGFSFLCGPFALKFIARFGERPVGICSGLSAGLSIFTSSFVQDIWILYVSYGVFVGFFMSCQINSISLTMRKYFKNKLAMALGFTTSGASVGVLTVGPAFQVLVDTFGWRKALRVMSGIVLLSGLLCIFFDPNVEENNKQADKQDYNELDDDKMEDSHAKMCCSLWKTPKYTIGTISIFLTFFGIYVPLIHLLTFAKDRKISASKSSLLFIYIGILSTISRLLIGKVLDRKWLTPLQAVQLFSLLIGISLVVFTQAKLYVHFIIFAIFYGFCNGAFMVAQFVFYFTCFGDLKMSSVGWTTAYVFSAIALFVGIPVAGFMADYFQSYSPAFFIFGGIIIFSSVLPLCLYFGSRKTARSEDEEVMEVQLRLIGSRLANVESSLNIIT